MSDGLMSAAEWKAEKERRARLLEGLDSTARQAMEEEWKNSDQERSSAAIEVAKEDAAAAAEKRRHRYEYDVVKIERDQRSDAAVVAEADAVINRYAQEGWRLHTYSQLALSRGAAAPIASTPFSNVLHLVFEREK